MFDADSLGIPWLDPTKQLMKLVPPVVPYGCVPRGSIMNGTYHGYCQDFKYTRLIANPERILLSGCTGVIEMNFSTGYPITRVAALFGVFQKRRLARVWQDAGIPVAVDLNVDESVFDMALLGVPEGWRSYCTRVHLYDDWSAIETRYALAVRHAGTADVFFVVVGGGAKVRKTCKARGFVYVPEYGRVVRGKEDAYHG